MADATAFVGDVPKNYDKHLGPFFFDFYAKDLATRVANLNPGSLLTLACGTGIDTLAVKRASPQTRITATDLNPDMLKIAEAKFGPGEVEFKVVDAQNLPFPDETFDAVTCQFGLMFMPDKDAVLREARRVLKKGGHLILSVWDSLDENPFPKLAHELFQETCETDPPQFLLVPFGFYDRTVLRGLFETNGFGGLTLEEVATTVHVQSGDEVAYGFIYGSPAYGQVKEHPEIKIERLTAELGRRMTEASGPDKKTRLQAVVVSGTK